MTPADFAAVLTDLEDLRVAAAYTEAGVALDDTLPLCDPAGRAAVGAMWRALTAELADDEWDRLVARWRRGVA